MMRKYLLILLTLFCIPKYLYAACCTVTNVESFIGLNFASGNIAFFENGANNCLAIVNPAAGMITTFNANDCALLLNQTSISSPSVTNIAVSNTLPNNCVATTNGDVITYYTASGCSLTVSASVAVEVGANAIAFSANGGCAVSTSFVNSAPPAAVLTSYSVNSSCALSHVNTVSTVPLFPINLSFPPSGFTCSGDTFFAVLYSNSNRVDLFSINNTCSISQLPLASITTAGDGGQSIAFSPQLCNGNALLAVDIAGQGVEIFTIDPTTCTATSLGVTNPGAHYSHSSGFAFTPNGTCLISNDQFINAGVQTSVTNIYSIDPTTCTLTNVQAMNFSTTITQGLAINPSGTCMAISFPNANPSGNFVINTYTFNGSPTVTITPSAPFSVCSGQSFSLTANPSPTGTYTFAWTGPNGFMAATKTITINDATVSDSGTYTVVVTDSNNCSSDPASNTVTVNDSPTVNISPTIQVVCPGQSINFTANESGGTGPFNYSWAGPNGFSEDTGTNPTLTIPNPTALNTGNYTVTVTDSTGCQDVSSIAQVVISLCT